MPYNPNIHHRRSIRLKGYDYSQAGLYFITICCQDKICRFGKIENGEMILNDFGKIAHNEWEKLSERYPNVILDEFQIMPNHVHGIIVLDEMPTMAAATVGATLAVALNEKPVAQNDNAVAQNNDAVALNNDANIRATARVAPTGVGNVVGAYKSLVANECLDIYKMRNQRMGKLWQRNYYEHIIRNDNSYQRISNYIMNNPKNWNSDKFYSEEN